MKEITDDRTPVKIRFTSESSSFFHIYLLVIFFILIFAGGIWLLDLAIKIYVGWIACPGIVLFLIGLITAFSNEDYLILDPERKYVISGKKILFNKIEKELCPIDRISAVNITCERVSGRGSVRDIFSLELVLPDNKIIETNISVSVPVNGSIVTYSAYSITDLRDLAFRIASMSGCRIGCPDISPVKEIMQREGKKKVEDTGETYRKCPSCSASVPRENSFCTECGAEM
jgi:hypothetical protein